MKFQMMIFIATTALIIISSAGTCLAQEVFRSVQGEVSGFIKHADKLPPDAIYMNTSGSFEHVLIDPHNHILFAVVKESSVTKGPMYGHVIAIDLKNDRALWTKYYNGDVMGLILYDTIPILLCSSFSEAFSPENGSSI